MFSNNKKISGRQMNRMLALDIFAVSFMLLPKFLFRTSGGQGFYSVFTGTICVIGYSALLYYTATRYDDSLFEYTKRVLGRIPAWGIMIFFAARFLLSAVYLLKLFSQVINQTFLTEMPQKVIGAFLIVIALYGVSKGMETRGRFGSILFWVIIIPIFLIVIMSVFQAKPSYIFPMEITDISGIIDGAYSVIVVFSIVEFVLFSAPYMRNKKHGFHFIVKAILFGAVTALIIYMVCMGVMTKDGASSERWPSVILMQIIKLPGGFLSRQDGLMLSFWIMAAFMAVSGYIFYVDEIAHQLFPEKYFKGVLFAWMILVYAAFCYIEDFAAFEQMYFKISLWGGVIPTVFILSGLLIKYELGKKK